MRILKQIIFTQTLLQPIPLTMKSSSGNQMGYDLAMGSPPLQDMQLVERLQAFQGESMAQFQQVTQVTQSKN